MYSMCKKGDNLPMASSRKPRGKFLIVAILVAVTIIVLLDVFCILSAFYAPIVNEWVVPSETSTTEASGEGNDDVDYAKSSKNMESALLTTGLSIIGIAISVWAALNITNAIERRDFDALQDKFVQHENSYEKRLEDLTTQQTDALSELKQKHNDEFIDLQKKQQEELGKIKSDREKQTEQQQRTSKNLLLSEMLKTISDISTEIIMEQTQSISAKEVVPFAELTHIEQHFARVYSLHAYRKETILIKTTADIGIAEAEELLLELDNDVPHKQMISEILNYRIGDFCFYKAYCCQGKERLTLAQKAIDQYLNSLNLFNISIPDYEYQEEYIPVEYIACPKGKKRISAYICNAIGEAYSKIIQEPTKLLLEGITKKEIQDFGRKAVYFCAYAVKWCENDRELYFRNLGCALERVLGNEMFSEKNVKTITQLYQDAFDISANQGCIPEKVFYTWLSFDRKWSNHVIAQIRGDIRDHKWLCSKSELVTEQLRNRADIAIHYGQLAKETYSDILVHHKFFAFTLRNACVWEILSNGKTKAAYRHYKKFRQAVVVLNAFYPDPSQWDDFMKELNQHEKEVKTFLGTHIALVTTK